MPDITTLSKRPVSELMKKNLVVLDKSTPLSEAIKEMYSRSISHILVKQRDEIIGVISEKDIIFKLISRNSWKINVSSLHVSSAMSQPLIYVSPNTEIVNAVKIMLRGIGILPVKRGKNVLGVVTKEDVVSALKFEEERLDFVMNRRPIISSPNERLINYLVKIAKNRISSIPVVEYGKLLGLVTDLEAMYAVYRIYKLASWNVREERSKRILMKDVMKRRPSFVSLDAPLNEVCRKLAEGVKSVLVTQDDVLVGLISKTDVLEYMLGIVRG